MGTKPNLCMSPLFVAIPFVRVKMTFVVFAKRKWKDDQMYFCFSYTQHCYHLLCFAKIKSFT